MSALVVCHAWRPGLGLAHRLRSLGALGWQAGEGCEAAAGITMW